MPVQFETLIASTLFLLSRQRAHLPAELQQRITEHIALLLQTPEMERYPDLEEHCLMLFGHWREALEKARHNMQNPLVSAAPELH